MAIKVSVYRSIRNAFPGAVVTFHDTLGRSEVWLQTGKRFLWLFKEWKKVAWTYRDEWYTEDETVAQAISGCGIDVNLV